MRTIAIMSMILIVIAGLGCVAEEEDSASLEEAPEQETTETNDQSITSTYTEDNYPNTAYGIKGDVIIVELDENPTTGYSWNLTYSSGLELNDDVYAQENGTEGMTGAGGTHKWTFKITDTGKQNISAVYMRPWENVTGEEDTFDMTIMSLSEDELIEASGTVSYMQLEGGFYGIIAEDDSRYDPMNLPEEFQNDGMNVEFVAYPRNDVMSFHMWGQIVELRSITEINE